VIRFLEYLTLCALAGLLIWCGALIYSNIREQARTLEIITELRK